ncbi:MAG TPA: Gfo/Idh/MocA family oxidoreductase, partial [Burkholderiales bacterium]
MTDIAQFGAGRIGQIHAANIAAMKDVRLRYVIDVNAEAAQKLAARYGAKVVSEREAFADREVGAVLIASSTDTHARLAIAAARAGKAIFCE